MILTIEQYMEALANPEGRFRTLRRLYPAPGENGEPLFSVPGHGLADFEVVADGRRMMLRCPLRSNAATEANLRSLADKDKGLSSEFFTEWEVLEKEMVLFDGGGNPVETDILARPAVEGASPERFLQDAAAAGDRVLILSALRSLSELAQWLESTGREAALRRLLFAPDGSVAVTGFSACGELNDVALALFFTALQPGMYAEIGRQILSKAAAVRPVVAGLCSAVSALGVPEAAQILAGDVAGPLSRLAELPLQTYLRLGQGIAGCVEAPREESSLAPVDLEYAWAEEESDGIRCVRDTDGWHYVARDGRPVVDRTWLSASPFREGRAEVETAEGKGLIDKQGRYILEPVYEELVWDEYWGLVSVMDEGRWSLLDREGNVLTDTFYDWLGECSEGLILAQKDGKCGFIDTAGREAIPFVYDDATSFSEGCSFVTFCHEADGSEGWDDQPDSFYIDSKGNPL